MEDSVRLTLTLVPLPGLLLLSTVPPESERLFFSVSTGPGTTSCSGTPFGILRCSHLPSSSNVLFLISHTLRSIALRCYGTTLHCSSLPADLPFQTSLSLEVLAHRIPLHVESWRCKQPDLGCFRMSSTLLPICCWIQSLFHQ